LSSRIPLAGAVVFGTLQLLREAKPVIAAESRSRSRLRVRDSRSYRWIVRVPAFEH